MLSPNKISTFNKECNNQDLRLAVMARPNVLACLKALIHTHDPNEAPACAQRQLTQG